MQRDAALLEDWITIWQSEAAALCSDRELQEAMQRGVDAWADQVRLVLRAWPGDDGSAGPAGPIPAAGAASAGAAPDERDVLIERLRDRVAELERRLAGT